MQKKIINLLTILSSLCIYLEWGNHQHSFLASAEAEVFRKLLTEPSDVLHPLTILPLAGQIILLISLFQKIPARRLTLTGLALLGILPLFICVIGIISLNYKIALSTLPFLICSMYAIRINRRPEPGG